MCIMLELEYLVAAESCGDQSSLEYKQFSLPYRFPIIQPSSLFAVAPDNDVQNCDRFHIYTYLFLCKITTLIIVLFIHKIIHASYQLIRSHTVTHTHKDDKMCSIPISIVVRISVVCIVYNSYYLVTGLGSRSKRSRTPPILWHAVRKRTLHL